MNFMEILWKEHGMTIAKATTTLDEIMAYWQTNLGMSKVDLKEALTNWGKEYGENAMIFWTDKDIEKPNLLMGSRPKDSIPHTRKTPKIKDKSFMKHALIQIKTSDNKVIIEKLVDLIIKEKTGREKIISERDRDEYTQSGKKGGAEIREYTAQESALASLLNDIEKGYNYKKNNKLLRELIENKVLSSSYLSIVSYDLFSSSDTKKVHPRLIEKLKQPNTFKAFMEYLKSNGKNLPKTSTMRGALKVLSGKKAGGKRILDVLLNRPEEYRFSEDIYDNHLKTINSFIKKNIENFDNTTQPIKIDNQWNWTDFLNTIRDKYNSNSNLTIEEFEGKEIVKLIKEVLEDIEDLKRAQKAKVKLIEIGQSNGKSGTINSDDYDSTMASIKVLKQTYYFDRHMDEAQRKTDDSAPGKLEQTKPKKTSPVNFQQQQIYNAYKDYRKAIWKERQELKGLKEELEENDTELSRTYDKEQLKLNPDYKSHASKLKEKMEKTKSKIDRMSRSLDALEDKYPDITFKEEEE